MIEKFHYKGAGDGVTRPGKNSQPCKMQDCGCCDQILNFHFRPPRPPGRRFGRVGRGGGGNEICYGPSNIFACAQLVKM